MVVDHRKYTNSRPVMRNKYVAPRFRVRDYIFNYAFVAVYTVGRHCGYRRVYKKIRDTSIPSCRDRLAINYLKTKKRKKENKEKEKRDGGGRKSWRGGKKDLSG